MLNPLSSTLSNCPILFIKVTVNTYNKEYFSPKHWKINYSHLYEDTNICFACRFTSKNDSMNLVFFILFLHFSFSMLPFFQTLILYFPPAFVLLWGTNKVVLPKGNSMGKEEVGREREWKGTSRASFPWSLYLEGRPALSLTPIFPYYFAYFSIFRISIYSVISTLPALFL